MGQIIELNNKGLEHIQKKISRIVKKKKKLVNKEKLKSKLSEFHCKYISITVIHLQMYVFDDIFF